MPRRDCGGKHHHISARAHARVGIFTLRRIYRARARARASAGCVRGRHTAPVPGWRADSARGLQAGFGCESAPHAVSLEPGGPSGVRAMGGGGEAEIPQDPLLVLRSKISLAALCGDAARARALAAEITAECEAGARAGVYERATRELGLDANAALITRMRAANTAKLAEMDAKIADAEENLGDSEVREALLAKAEYLLGVNGGGEEAEKALKACADKTVAVGHKIDMELSCIRAAYFALDIEGAKEHIELAKKLFAEGGGDWERKNRLKVYEGLFLLMARKFDKSADLLLDSIATFTSTELLPYETFVSYTIITAIFTLERMRLKKKVVDAPEVLAVSSKIPNVAQMLNAFYECRYCDFMVAFAAVIDEVKLDPYLSRHSRYFVREARVAVYSQYLASYQSVTVTSMASAFGVSTEFLDGELSSFIAAGRLSAKIDKVAGIITTSRADIKTGNFNKVIKEGDALLNDVAKLRAMTSAD